MKLINYLSRAKWKKHKGAIHPTVRILSSRTLSTGGIFWICTEDDKAGRHHVPTKNFCCGQCNQGAGHFFLFCIQFN